MLVVLMWTVWFKRKKDIVFLTLYSAGLEGVHSVYTKYENFEIMFHVSTLLPFNPDDHQQVYFKHLLYKPCTNVIY